MLYLAIGARASKPFMACVFSLKSFGATALAPDMLSGGSGADRTFNVPPAEATVNPETGVVTYRSGWHKPKAEAKA
jgi:hypothetical protein